MKLRMKRRLGMRPGGQRPSSPRRLLFMYHMCSLGGVEASLVNKMGALRAMGVDVHFLFERHWGPGAEAFAQHQPGFFVEPDAKERRRLIDAWQPEAIVVIDAPWLIESLEVAELACPVLFETHLSDADFFEERMLRGALNEDVMKVLACSEFHRRWMVDRGLEPSRIHVIANGLDFDRFHPRVGTEFLQRLGLPSGRPVLLFIGRIDPHHKNPLDFVRICKSMLAGGHDIHGVVVGAAVETREYEATVRAEAAAISDHIDFIERIPYEEMPFLYSAVAESGGCLVSTSLHEAQPMIMLEAMASGCPVVATDVGGVSEIVHDGSTGHLFPFGDLTAAAVAITRLTGDMPHRAEAVRSALDYVHENHSPERTAREYVAVLDELAGVAGARREIEFAKVKRHEPAGPILGFRVDRPRPGARQRSGSYDIAGWVLGHPSHAPAFLNLYCNDVLIASVTPTMPRPDVAAAFPNHPSAARSGWRFRGDSSSLPEAFSFSVTAVFEPADDGHEHVLAELSGS